MPKIQRETQKIFCNSAESDQLAVFGSMATGAPVYSNNIEELQNNEAFDLGWDAATLEDKAPFMEEMNGMQYGITKQLAYNFQEGIPEYDAGTTYYTGSIVKVLEDSKPVLYTSLTDENLGNNPIMDATNWEKLSFGGGGLEIGDIGFTQMAIDETKGKRRILNGQVIIQDQYVEFTNIVKASVELNPDIACTESEWQTEVTMNTFGLCGKFVIDNEAGTIRLPKYPNYFVAGLANIAPVIGNGIAIGLEYKSSSTSDLYNFGLNCGGANDDNRALYSPELYGLPLGSSAPSTTTPIGTQLLPMGLTTDPTKSGIEAQIDEKQITGAYFIQVATGAETEDNIINEIELNNPFSLLDYKFSEYELNNLSWLRSNGQYNSKAIYPAVYDLLLKIYNGTETKAGVSVKLSTEAFTDYDFVLNTAEETFRLPIKVKLASGKAVVGNGLGLGLTSNGSNLVYPSTNTTPTNANYYTWPICSEGVLGVGATVAGGGYATGNTTAMGVTTDPTKSGLELSDSDLYLYFYVGETVQNANLINAGRIEEKLTSYLSINNKEEIVSWGMPDYSAGLQITLSATDFVAPCDGIVAGDGNRAGTDNETNIYVNGAFVGKTTNSSQAISINLSKGDALTVSAGNVTTYFYPLKGVN